MTLCEYGCGQEAKHQFKNGKWCCSAHYLKCSIYRNKRKKEGNPFFKKHHNNETIEKIRNTSTGRKISPFIKVNNKLNILCNLGCGRIAKYKSIISEKYYCESNASNCIKIKEINKNKNIGILNSERQKFRKIKNININNLCDYGCKKVAKYKNRNNKYCCSEFTTQCLNRTTKYSIEDYKKLYPIFSQIEEMRYEPGKEKERIIQVHCKNHLCPNSKEKGGWFTPTKTQLYERSRNIDKLNRDFSYFYCSSECKDQCPLYRSRGNDPFIKKEYTYTQEEYQQFREHVLERDNHTCQYCDEPAEHVHHERPQKLEPFYSLDPDYAWSVCSKCHYEKGHKNECSTGQIANIICK